MATKEVKLGMEVLKRTIGNPNTSYTSSLYLNRFFRSRSTAHISAIFEVGSTDLDVVGDSSARGGPSSTFLCSTSSLDVGSSISVPFPTLGPV